EKTIGLSIRVKFSFYAFGGLTIRFELQNTRDNEINVEEICSFRLSKDNHLTHFFIHRNG
ncbi:MAG: hypothetical protein JSV14_12060, partial [Deltaproteobacteria bacterium]